VESGSEISKFQGHLDSVNSFVLSSKDSEMFSGSSDQAVCWWDVGRGQLIRKLRCHNGAVNSVCYNDDSSVAISGGYDSTVKIWDSRVPSQQPIQILAESRDSITAVATSKYEIFSGSVDGKLRIYDIRQSCLTVDSVGNRIVSIDLSGDQQTILMSTLDSKIVLYVKYTGDIIQSYQGHRASEYVIRSRFAGNDGAVVSGSETGEVFVWELVEASVQQKFSFGEGPVLDVAIQKDFVSIAAGSANGEIGLFKRAT
jgi:mitogen-activated protein kinase organizer 1